MIYWKRTAKSLSFTVDVRNTPWKGGHCDNVRDFITITSTKICPFINGNIEDEFPFTAEISVENEYVMFRGIGGSTVPDKDQHYPGPDLI